MKKRKTEYGEIFMLSWCHLVADISLCRAGCCSEQPAVSMIRSTFENKKKWGLNGQKASIHILISAVLQNYIRAGATG